MMTPSPSATASPSTAQRPVLFWQPDSDESHVQANLEQAAAFLNVPAEAVVAAIKSGDLLGGWFVDWEASRAA